MIEVCCGSFEDAMMASECGVKRVELNSALSLGGLTPSLGSLIMIKQYSDIEVVSMVRARAGGFNYTNYQYEQMLENLKLLLAYGTDGVSFGFLNEDRTINKNRCQDNSRNSKYNLNSRFFKYKIKRALLSKNQNIDKTCDNR